MDARLIERIETGIERAAAALFAGAVGYAAHRWKPPLGFYVAAPAALAYALCGVALRRLAPHGPRFAVPVFDIRQIDALGPADELILTEADRIAPDELLLTDDDRFGAIGELLLTDSDRLQPAVGPLVLDDILAEIGPDARVVRLFDQKSMPTPGQLKSRIDDHLGQGAAPAGSTDASQALSEALAELRRSLR